MARRVHYSVTTGCFLVCVFLFRASSYVPEGFGLGIASISFGVLLFVFALLWDASVDNIGGGFGLRCTVPTLNFGQADC